jgi:1,4-alpha-glucan branching enzyme
VDAVAAMLYLDYDKEPGQWVPNHEGTNNNLEAIAFFRKLNKAVFGEFPDILMIAEESTAFPMITKPVSVGGLGFNYKWNMGWMNDVLSYVETDPIYRSGCHDKLTFSMYYAFSENYVLPISHDEVVHGKKSLLDKMHGNIEQKFASMRAFLMYMFAHPGKKLSFMGNEYGQFKEWDYAEGLEFFMLEYPLHQQLKSFNKKLNKLYKSIPALYEIEDSWQGFTWIAVDERENNVLSFVRRDRNGNELLAVLNFSGRGFPEYRIGTEKGEYKVVLNSNEKRFGGYGKSVRKPIKTLKIPAHGKEDSIGIALPEFSAVYFIKNV